MGLPAALIASWPLAACDDDSAGPAGDDTLTDEEVVALVDGLTAVAGLIGADAATPVVDQPAVQCPMAGTMGFSARVTPRQYRDDPNHTHRTRRDAAEPPVHGPGRNLNRQRRARCAPSRRSHDRRLVRAGRRKLTPVPPPVAPVRRSPAQGTRRSRRFRCRPPTPGEWWRTGGSSGLGSPAANWSGSGRTGPRPAALPSSTSASPSERPRRRRDGTPGPRPAAA